MVVIILLKNSYTGGKFMSDKKLIRKDVLNVHTYKSVDKKNGYFTFIQSCIEKYYSESVTLQSHHIIPKYVFRNGSVEDKKFMDSSANLISLSVEDHAKAHSLLFEIYGNMQDQGATYLLENHQEEGQRTWKVLGAKASHKIQEKNEISMWSNEFQKEMAARSMARPDALQIRSEGGKKGGKKRNEGIAIKPHQRFTFSYKGKEILCVLNCKTGGDVLCELKKFLAVTGEETKLSRVTNLLSGERKSLYGFSCKNVDNP